MDSNAILKIFVSEIEAGLKTFSNLLKKTITYNLSYEKDYEIPDLEKLVLSIDIKNVKFESKLQLWDQLDQVIRERIYKKNNDSNELEKSIITQMNEDFIIKLKPL